MGSFVRSVRMSQLIGLLAFVFVMVFAWRLSGGLDLGVFEIIRPLGEYEWFHIVAHVAICGSVAFVLGPQQSGAPFWRWAIAFGVVLLGGIGIEVAQVFGAATQSYTIPLQYMAKDVVVDSAGALLGLALLWGWLRRKNA